MLNNQINLRFFYFRSIVVALAAGIFSAFRPEFLVIGLFLIMCFGVIMKYPELGLSLFVFTGVLKTAPIFPDPYAYYPTAILLITSLFFLLLLKAVQGRFNLIKFDMTLTSLILLIFFLFVSAYLFSPNQGNGLVKAARFLIFTLPIFFMVMLLKNDLIRIRRLLLGIVWIGIAFVAIVVFKLFLFLEPLPERLTLFRENYIVFGRAVGITSVLLISLLIYDKEITKIQKLVFTLFLPPMILVLFLSGSRGSFFSFLLTIGFILIFGTQIKVFWQKTVLFILVAGSIIMVFNSGTYKLLAERYLFQTPDSKLSLVHRIYNYERAVDCFLFSPLLGVGTGGYNFESLDSENVGDYPHNIFLEIASEGGLVGLLLFSIPFILTVTHFYKIQKSNLSTILKKRTAIIAFAGGAYTFITAQISGDIQINRLIWLFIAIIWALYHSRPHFNQA